MLVVLAGTLPRNVVFFANLRLFPGVPWAVPATAAYIWFFWRYLKKNYPENLRAKPVAPRIWLWALIAGGLAIAALVLALRLVNHYIPLPPQDASQLSGIPSHTVVALLLMAAPVAGIIEEAAFRGYMQYPIEQRYGLPIAILITGTMFAVAHLDFTPILWPYYVAVAAIYGIVAHLTQSILPAIVLHTAGNVYSNLDLWLHGQAEWQKSTGSSIDSAPALATALGITAITAALATTQLTRITRNSPA